MPLATIRTKAEDALRAAGFAPDSYAWVANPNRLVVAVAGKVKVVAMHGRMSAAKFERVLGRLEGWADLMRAA